MTINLKKSKFLIIDDIPFFRIALKQIVQEIGGEDIQQAANAKQAIKMIEKESFDYIFCDYNLPNGRNGQQILEELTHRKLIKSNMIYIMVTGESAYDMVMAALEYYPDIYLTKPISPNDLIHRIERVVAKKQNLNQVGIAIDAEKYELADQLLDNVLSQKNNPSHLEALRLKMSVEFHLKKYKQIIQTMKALLDFREIPWARLSLGKAYFYTPDYEKATTEFANIFDQNVAYVKAGDWLAKTLIELKEYQLAQEILMTACEQSPRGIQRQQMLARVAQKNNDVETAIKAFKMAASLGKYSIHRNSDDYIQYTEYIIEDMVNNEGLLSKQNSQLALQTIDKMVKDFNDDPVSYIKANLKKFSLCELNGLYNQAQATKKELERYVKKIWNKISGIEKASIATLFYEHDLKDTALEYALKILSKYQDNVKVVAIIREFYSSQIVDMSELKKMHKIIHNNVLSIDKVAQGYFKSGSIDKAVESFAMAYKEMIIGWESFGTRINTDVCLDGANALLTWMTQNNTSLKELRDVEEYLSKCNHLTRSDERFEQYIGLQSLFRRISKKYENEYAKKN